MKGGLGLLRLESKNVPLSVISDCGFKNKESGARSQESEERALFDLLLAF